jgi:hypothetical protein
MPLDYPSRCATASRQAAKLTVLSQPMETMTDAAGPPNWGQRKFSVRPSIRPAERTIASAFRHGGEQNRSIE